MKWEWKGRQLADPLTIARLIAWPFLMAGQLGFHAIPPANQRASHLAIGRNVAHGLLSQLQHSFAHAPAGNQRREHGELNAVSTRKLFETSARII